MHTLSVRVYRNSVSLQPSYGVRNATHAADETTPKTKLESRVAKCRKYTNTYKFFDVTKIGKRRAGVAQINKRRNDRQRE